jgi:DNA-binding transcriptional LysR family regulator
MRRIGQGVAGHVEFGLGPLIASATLSEAIPSLLMDYPEITVQTVIDNASKLLPQVLNDTIEFAICSKEMLQPSPGVAVETICEMTVIVLARADHPCRGQVVRLGKMCEWPVIGGSGTASEDENAVYHPAVSCDNFDILRRITLASDSLWVTSAAAARNELASGALIAIEHEGRLQREFEVVLISRRGRTMLPAASIVADRLIAALVVA